MIRRTRPLAALGAFVILASACGSGTPEPAAQPAATDTPAAAVDDGQTDDAADTAADSDPAPVESPAPAAEGDTAAETTDEPAPDETDPVVTDDSGAEGGDAAETTDPPATPAAAAWPDDGCSTDGSPTPTDAAEGPAPALEVRAESGDSLLPDVPVRRINCNGGWVNFQNELPSEQPLLVWFWAPH